MTNNRVKGWPGMVALLLSTALVAVDSSHNRVMAESGELQELVQGVWSLVNSQYVDGTFNNNNWQTVRSKYVVKAKYQNKKQAYKAVREMLKKLNDPYTQFLEPEEFSQRQASLANTIVGVGMTTEDPLGQPSIVISVVEGSPAEGAGLQAGDLIVAVDGKKVRKMSAGVVTQAIRGKQNTPVVLTIQRAGKTLNRRIIRQKINFPTVKFAYKPDEQIGYIRLSQFGDNAAKEMRAALTALETNPVRGYVLDLRGNPGGRVDVAAEIASEWMGESVLTAIRDRNGGCTLNFSSLAATKCRLVTEGTAVTDKPLVVLVNASSASASEMLAGSFQDNHRAIVLGDKTYGKGVVQSIFSLPDGAALTLTTDKYLTPNGRDIHKIGIVPDVKLVLKPAENKTLFRTQSKLGTKADRQYTRAVELLRTNWSTAPTNP
jgi:carboxyl-terminal processing protease